MEANTISIDQIGCSGGGYTTFTGSAPRSGTYSASDCSDVWIQATACDQQGCYQTGVLGNSYTVYVQWGSGMNHAHAYHQLCYPSSPCTNWYYTSETYIIA